MRCERNRIDEFSKHCLQLDSLRVHPGAIASIIRLGQ